MSATSPKPWIYIHQSKAIPSSSRPRMGMQSRIWLCVLRVDDQRYDGAVDLYVERESQLTLMDRLRCNLAMAHAQDQNVDLAVQLVSRNLPKYRIARHNGSAL
jgi:hypothetical protein